MKFTSLKFQIPFTILVFALSSIIITVALLNNVTSKHLREDILKRNLGISEMIGEHIYLYLQNAKDTVDTAAKFASESYGNMEGIKEEIFRIYDNFNYFDLIFFIDGDGFMLFSKPDNEDAYRKYNYKDRDYFQGVMNDGKSHISNLHISRVLGELHFIIASPVFDENNEVVGLIGAGIPLPNIETVANNGQKNFDGKIYITDSLGTLLIHPDIKDIKEVYKLEDNPIVLDDKMGEFVSIMESNTSSTLSYQRDGNEYHSAISFIEEVNWMIVAEQSEETMLKETIWLGEKLKLITLVLTVAVLMTGLLFAHKITYPIERLVTEVEKLGQDYATAEFMDIESYNEINKLANSFNNMSIRLRDNINQLNISYNRENYYRQYLDNILKSLGSGMIVVDENGYITIFNDAAEKITGISKSQSIGENIGEILDKISLNLDGLIEKIINRKEESIFIERNIINCKNESIPISLFISPVIEGSSQIIGIIYSFNDISDTKKLEKEISRLDRMHILGELSASLIHDVGNPLAGIKNLLELAEDNWEDKKLRKDIYIMLNREIEDLNDLVVNYLSFSKDTSTDRVSTNIFDLMDEVINLLKPEIISKNVELSKNYMGREYSEISINRNNIKQALINILLNCIQASKEDGFINIQAKGYRDKIEINIRDNGTGIKKENIGKVFEPFYTTKKGGTGLGLSSTYKIIKEHEGNINIDSQWGKGTEFNIILKKQG